MEASKLAEALAKVQAELKPIQKTADNPFFKSKYADLASVSEVILPLLAKNNLSVTQEGAFVGIETPQRFVIKTTLRHISGESTESVWPVMSKDNTAQGLGSGSTYARRYALMAIVGASATEEDDDGNVASGKSNIVNTAKETKPTNPVAPVGATPGKAGDYVMPFGNDKGKAIKLMHPQDLESAINWAKSPKANGRYGAFVDAASEYLADFDRPAGLTVHDDEIPF